MKFLETELNGVFIIKFEKLEDERGFFARTFCNLEFSNNGLISHFVQVNNSFTKSKGTIRGMHYQLKPSAEVKLVRCINGALYDVIIDLRPDSKTFKKWCSFELTEDNYKMLYIPKGFAHGFQTLEDNTEISYQISEFYHPEYAKGIRWDDKTFRIEWPLNVSLISENDLDYTPFEK